MFKPIKKTFLLVAGIAVLALSLVSCGPKPDEGLVEKEVTQDDSDSLAQSSWAFVTYPLSEFAGKTVKIQFSCQMKVDNPDGNTFEADNGYTLKWQVNSDGYPVVAEHVFTADETDWVTVEGTKEGLAIAGGNVLYLSTNNESDKVTVSIKDVKYTVTYGADKKAPKAKTYPTDIFTVGEAGSCGITLRDTKEAFTIFTDGSAAANIKTEADGSVSWVATAAGGGGGGVAFYVKSTKEEIQIGNYDSIDIELVYSPITGAWNPEAQKPSFCMRILPWDSTGMFGGYEDLLYFDATEDYGTLTKNIPITADFVEKIKKSAGEDSVLGFAIKFNDYNKGLTDGDQLKVQLKSVKFNAKSNAAADKAYDDGLTAAQRGTVEEINYPTRDWSIEADKVTDADKYNKHGWVYLPAGYDPKDTATKYPVFILLHGFGQNENTWGLSNKGRGGKIKGYMDKGMLSGKVEKFILVCVTGVADKSWGPNGSGYSFTGYNYFGGELRNDLLPWLRENYNIKYGRDNVAMAGLSMGGGQTFTIGIAQCLDLISNFAGFSGALFGSADDFMAGVDGTADFKDLKIHNLYMICGDKDTTVNKFNETTQTYPFEDYIKAIKDWDRIENFESYIFPGGTHDFPVWYYGFNDFIQMVFQEGVQLYK